MEAVIALSQRKPLGEFTVDEVREQFRETGLSFRDPQGDVTKWLFRQKKLGTLERCGRGRYRLCTAPAGGGTAPALAATTPAPRRWGAGTAMPHSDGKHMETPLSPFAPAGIGSQLMYELMLGQQLLQLREAQQARVSGYLGLLGQPGTPQSAPEPRATKRKAPESGAAPRAQQQPARTQPSPPHRDGKCGPPPLDFTRPDAEIREALGLAPEVLSPREALAMPVTLSPPPDGALTRELIFGILKTSPQARFSLPPLVHPFAIERWGDELFIEIDEPVSGNLPGCTPMSRRDDLRCYRLDPIPQELRLA